jgi:peptide/nickel transport system permease protein
MTRYLMGRLVQTIPVLFIISVIVFSLVLIIPGDPLRALMGPGATMTAEGEAAAGRRG